MEVLVFLSEQWLLVSVLCVLIYVYAWREKAKSGTGLSVHQLTLQLNQGESVLIDIRDSAEFKLGHIVDAINIPHNKLAQRVEEFAKYQDKTIILVDKLGQHVGNAGRLLRSKGYQVARLEGGIAEWQGLNLPLIK